MAASKVMTGARALVQIADPNNGNSPKIIGFFNSVSWGSSDELSDIYILGRYSADEIVPTARNTVHVTCSGWRSIGHGAHQDAGYPHLQDLLQSDNSIELAIVDRQTGVAMGKIHSCRCEGYSTSLAARQPEEITVTYRGLLADDESLPANAESNDVAGGPASLP